MKKPVASLIIGIVFLVSGIMNFFIGDSSAGVAFVFAILFLVWYFVKLQNYIKLVKDYQQTEYYKQTGNDFDSIQGQDDGKTGEYRIFTELESITNDVFKVFFNLYVPKEDGSTSEIDAVCVYPKGIVVIESKFYSGWIFGNENDKYWTQIIYQKRSRFLNPIIQNKGHIKALSNYLNVSIDCFYSMIVFSNGVEIKTEIPRTKDYCVIYRNQLKEEIINHFSAKERIWSNEETAELCKRLSELTNATDEIKAKHIQDIRNNQR